MSYRDLRNFSETMRVLGFPRPISLESSRVPNWELMEECLRWLAARVVGDVELPVGDKVALVNKAITLFHSHAGLKLSGKRVYGADGWAVRELLKAASFLRDALTAPPPDLREDAAGGYDISSRLGEIKQARALSTEMTARGALLYDLLGKEADNREARELALSLGVDLSAMEAGLRRALDAVSARVAAARDRIENVAASEAALDAKLERRRAELDRAEKRLRTVQNIKPAYQGELSALEGELERQWEGFVLRYRCVEALKHQLSLLEAAHAQEAEEQQAAIMRLIHKYEAEDVLGKLADSDETGSSEEGGELSEVKARPATRPKTRLRIKTAGPGGGTRDSLDDIRDEGDSRSDSDYSDTDVMYGGSGGEERGRWPRAASRPVTRTIAPADMDLTEHADGPRSPGDASLGSSSESELRVESATLGRSSALSDNEF